MLTKTISFKVRPECWAWLDQAAREVNQVWNFCNDTSHRAIRPFAGSGKWLSAFDLNKLMAGCGDGFQRIGIDVAQCVAKEYVDKRVQARKTKLAWRVSSGAKRSLGWIPFKTLNIRVDGKNRLAFMGKRIRLFEQNRYLGFRSEGTLRQGNFSQNALGEWFFSQTVDIQRMQLPALDPHSQVGIDPGSKTAMTLSTGETFAYTFYRDAEHQISGLQKRGHKKQAKRVHQKVRNTRRHQFHQDTNRLVQEHARFFIGDMSSSRLKKRAKSKSNPDGSYAKRRGPRLGKSLSDGAVAMWTNMLIVKSHWAGRHATLVNERFTTQVCSNCGQRTGPKGLRQLVVRQWTCSACGAEHERDINSAVNMLTAPVSPRNPSAQPKSRLPSAGTRFTPPASLVQPSRRQTNMDQAGGWKS